MEHKHSSNYILIAAFVVFSLILVSSGRLRGQMAGTARSSVAEPNSYVFQLEVGAVLVAEYTECSGLGSTNDIKESVVANDVGATVIQKAPGDLRWPDITLKRKGLSDENVWSWRKAMAQGDPSGIEDGAITMFGARSTEPLARWEFRKGWAASLTVEGSTEVLIIVHEGLERVAAGSVGGGPPVRPR